MIKLKSDPVLTIKHFIEVLNCLKDFNKIEISR